MVKTLRETLLSKIAVTKLWSLIEENYKKIDAEVTQKPNLFQQSESP